VSRVQIPRNVSLDDRTGRILKHEGEEVGLSVSALNRAQSGDASGRMDGGWFR